MKFKTAIILVVLSVFLTHGVGFVSATENFGLSTEFAPSGKMLINSTDFYTKPRSYEACVLPGGCWYVTEPRKGENFTNYFRAQNLTDEYEYILMQFEDLGGDPSQEEIQILADDNISLFEYHGDHTYWAKAPRSVLETKSYDFVRWGAVVENTSLKIWPDLERTATDIVDVLILTYEPVSDAVIEKIDSLSRDTPRINENMITSKINRGDANKIASENFVKEIDAKGTIVKELDRSTQIVASDHVIDYGYNDASGITVGIIDDGIQQNHSHFSGITVFNSTNWVDSDTNPDPGCYGTSCEDSTHGTNIAGIISGSGTDDSRTLRAVSNDAYLLVERVFNGTSWVAPEASEDAIWSKIIDPDDDGNVTEDNSADVISISWARNGTGAYKSESNKVDEVINGLLGKNILIIKSAGNVGPSAKVSVPGTAKNVLTVGATADYRADDKEINVNGTSGTYSEDNLYIMSYSSRGTDDGRIKPDILAPGAAITVPWVYDKYGSVSGTSFAVPHAAAVAAQILKQYDATYGFSPSDIKAFLIAQTIGGGTTDSKDLNQSWGRLDAYRAVYKLNDEVSDMFGRDTVGEPGSGESQDVYWTASVPAGADKLIVALVWSDLAGTKNATHDLINDLDLYLKNPSGTTVSYTVEDDDKNNVEKYVIKNPASGDWELHVKAIDLDGTYGTQNFTIKWEVIDESGSATVDVTNAANATTIPRGSSFSIYATISSPSTGFGANDIWTNITVPSGLTLDSMEFDGTDPNKDVIGDIAPGKNRNTRTWEITGDTFGEYTVTIRAFGERMDDQTVDEYDTTTINVEKIPGDLCSGDSECFSGYCEGSANYSARCCSSAPPADGWLYCSGNSRESRDYYCDSNGDSQYETSDLEDCSAKISGDTDGSPTAYTVAGTVYDYITCSVGSCTNNTYPDSCSGTVLTEYGASGASYVSEGKECQDFEGDLYCSGGSFYREEWGCSGSPSYCNDPSVSDTLLDRDDSQAYCEYSENGCTALFWSIGGEVSPSTCCEDDTGEYRNFRNCTEGCVSEPNDVACCSSGNKCVYNNVCYASEFEGDIDGDGYNEFCDNGSWRLGANIFSIYGYGGERTSNGNYNITYTLIEQPVGVFSNNSYNMTLGWIFYG